MFREAMTCIAPNTLPLAESGILIQPVECGITEYMRDDVIALGLTFPREQTSVIERLLVVLRDGFQSSGHFAPGKTIRLERAACRITGKEWTPDPPAALSFECIAEEIKHLSTLDRFSILFTTPLRLGRPDKKPGHTYCDEDFFRQGQTGQIAHFTSRIPTQNGDFSSAESPRVVQSALLWQEVTWGKGVKKTKGGVVGTVSAAGSLSTGMASLLVLGQYTGVGLLRAFGFGSYLIPELDGARTIIPLRRATTLLSRTMATSALKFALERLPNSAPGSDGMLVDDARKAGQPLLESLSIRLADGAYSPGPVEKYALPKDDGTYRQIHVQNVVDRLVQRSVADMLGPSVDGALSALAFAYRKNRNRRGAISALRRAFSDGYSHGIKADIHTFFDSVDISKLRGMLAGILPREPLVDRLFSWLQPVDPQNNRGLPQGSPISPMLSNLYLQGFDREIEHIGFKLVRYADDFVLLTQEALDQNALVQRVEQSLAPLGLRLNPEKTQSVSSEKPFVFLGYTVDGQQVEEAEEDNNSDGSPWSPLFDEHWRSGISVYLTPLCQSAVSRGAVSSLTDESASIQEIPWTNIGRIVVTGRARFSGSVIYRAMTHRIPVAFIDVLGRLKGQFRPEYEPTGDLRRQAELLSHDATFQLAIASNLIAAKIRNSFVLLRRNRVESPELRAYEHTARGTRSLDSLRGVEGAAAREYFTKIATLVSPFAFTGRRYRPSPDPVNVMLSLGYTLMYNRISSALTIKGFDPCIGFYHQGRGRHAALASDLMEHLRHLVDRTVLAMIHRGEITPSHFTFRNGDVAGCRMSGEGFRLFVERFESTMNTRFTDRRRKKMSYYAYLDETSDGLRRSIMFGTPYEPLEID